MISPLLFGILSTLLIYYIFDFINGRPKNFPPGPIRLPFFGSYLFLIFKTLKDVPIELAEWSKKYKSNVTSLFLGPYKNIILHDYQTIQMLTRNEFDGRPDGFIIKLRAFGKRLGIFFTDGDFWLVQRRFALRHMRDFGFGRRSEKLENIIEFEMKEMIKHIENNHYMFKAPHFFAPGFVNLLVSILTGTTLDQNQRNYLEEIGFNSLLFQKNASPLGGFIGIFPWVRFFAPNVSGYHGSKNGNDKLIEFVQDLIENRKKLRHKEETEGFIDVYLQELENREKVNKTSFTHEQLTLTCVDFLLPTSSCVEMSLSLLIQRLIHHPDVQDKMFDEIKSVVGTGRLPTLNDRPSLLYCEATLREGMRIDTPINLGVGRETTTNINVQGYDIPKGTLVFANLWQMHHDEILWKDPFAFRPERFLTDDGKRLCKDMTLPFGLGRRVCAGETFARNGMFMFLVGLVQNFKFTVPPGALLPDLSDRANSALLTNCQEFIVQCEPRI